MKLIDGQILKGEVVFFNGESKNKSEKLLPLKIVQNKYKHKKKEPKRKLLTPYKNENMSDFFKRVDSESRQYLMEKDREALRLQKSLKNKKKREKRALKSLEKSQLKNKKLNENSELESTFSLVNTNRPSFGDVIDSPPSFSSKIKDKLEKAKKETKICNDLSEYVNQVRKAYSNIKMKRISESNKFFESKKKNSKLLNDFGDGWVGIGKFKREDE
ncbi:uncharacterized protein cubi_00817 [Cryptosporidium ubiquitum]|uniref:Uncharacterized protein n=1 Tax=Cryptosporidium ubiquitum TaxID=857276 RepID=A0A1J4M9J3_9CRYT|nr:uncharacterized protein cubi_00817 [Cryptosporidium ubiquitum]OII70889.1 hypothetical protein cubi_00817 [Cryptosporidium ubiquitum]